jgi:hypothetical protein
LLEAIGSGAQLGPIRLRLEELAPRRLPKAGAG